MKVQVERVARSCASTPDLELWRVYGARSTGVHVVGREQATADLVCRSSISVGRGVRIELEDQSRGRVTEAVLGRPHVGACGHPGSRGEVTQSVECHTRKTRSSHGRRPDAGSKQRRSLQVDWLSLRLE
jgi:hypothetical protein